MSKYAFTQIKAIVNFSPRSVPFNFGNFGDFAFMSLARKPLVDVLKRFTSGRIVPKPLVIQPIKRWLQVRVSWINHDFFEITIEIPERDKEKVQIYEYELKLQRLFSVIS